MALLWTIVANCRKEIRKVIMTIQPAGTKQGKFDPHKTSSGKLVETIEKTRKFDVISKGDPVQTKSWGTTANQRDVILSIVIGYNTDENDNELAQSDFLSIQYNLHSFDNSLIAGLHAFRVEDPEWKELEDFRYLIIPVVARVTTTNQ
jgi:hypothetical protein